MPSVPNELIAESIKLEQSGADVYLVDFYLNETETIYFCSGNESLTFNGQTYLPFPFSIGGREENADGNPSEISLTVDNATAVFSEWMDANHGLTDRTLKLWIGNSAFVSDPTKWWSQTLYITSATENAAVATFMLSASPVFDVAVPPYRFERHTCNRAYRSGGPFGCNYTSQSATIIGATNASPIVIETDLEHRFKDGSTVVIASVGGNTAANGTWTLVVVDGTHFSLTGSTGNGAYTSGGTAAVSLPTCDFTLFGPNGCAAHNNTLNFGGYPSIPRAQ
jgi:phage-related protein